MQQIIQALTEKGYRELSLYFDKKWKHSFVIYTNGKRVLCLQIYPNGDGWELFKPVADTNSIADAIAGIPE